MIKKFKDFLVESAVTLVDELKLPNAGLVTQQGKHNGSENMSLVLCDVKTKDVQAFVWLSRYFGDKDWQALRMLGKDKTGPLMLQIALSTIHPEYIVPEHRIKPRALEMFRRLKDDPMYESKPIKKDHPLYQDSFEYDVNTPGKEDDLDVVNRAYRIKKPLELKELLYRASGKLDKKEQSNVVKMANKEFLAVYNDSL